MGIDAVSDLPGVGENLQDHLEVYVQHSRTQPVSMAPYFAMKNRPKVGPSGCCESSGPGATNHFEAGGFVRSNDEVGLPNLMYHFLPIAVRYDGTAPRGRRRSRLPGARRAHVLRRARHLQGGQPRSAQAPGAALQLPLDRERPARVGRGDPQDARRSSIAPAFAPFSGGELSPGKEVETDEQILEWVAKDAETALHPSCTARMGTDGLAVTDPRSLRVHGVDGLRVVDASVFPYVTNGNIYAPVMMTAEKSADLILGNTPLPAENVEFYRHDASAAAEPVRTAPSM